MIISRGQMFSNDRLAVPRAISVDMRNGFFYIRTVLLCRNCGKRKFVRDYIPAPLNYSAVLEFCYLDKKLGDSTAAYEAVKDRLIKNKKQFLELFGDKYEI